MGEPIAILLTGFILAAGLCVGSFLNVVIYRLPRECLAVSKGRSNCPRCGGAIAWWDNLPVLAWLLLRGRSRCCRTPISVRYPFVELLTGLLWGAALLWIVPEEGLASPWAYGGDWLEFGVAALVISVLIALSFIDIDFRILPNELTKSGIVLGPVLAAMAPDLQPGAWPFAFEGAWGDRWSALCAGILGALVASSVLYGVGWLGSKAFKKPAMGLGDVKMIAAMGGLLGVWALFALIVAAVLGSVIGGLILALRKTRYIPFGPFLAVGMLVVMAVGRPLFDAYLSLMTP